MYLCICVNLCICNFICICMCLCICTCICMTNWPREEWPVLTVDMIEALFCAEREQSSTTTTTTFKSMDATWVPLLWRYYFLQPNIILRRTLCNQTDQLSGGMAGADSWYDRSPVLCRERAAGPRILITSSYWDLLPMMRIVIIIVIIIIHRILTTSTFKREACRCQNVAKTRKYQCVTKNCQIVSLLLERGEVWFETCWSSAYLSTPRFDCD